jgi:hypothetical protein
MTENTDICTDGVDLELTLKDFIATLDIQNSDDVMNYCLDLFKRAK